ncbi:hypothetical protein BGZ94_002757 [Podila epigama]|nr:hypothetical protein BGZ94_002757 [Podila epigama]
MKFAATVATVVSTLLVATSVQAHVTANPSVGTANAYFQTNFRVPHGCDGNATDRVIVEIPKGVTAVKPKATVPWTTTINMVPLDPPVVTPTGTVNTTVGSITWAGGNLPDNMYEDFGLQFKLPATTGPLYWMINQHCVNGEWNNWTGIPDAAGKTSGFPAAVIQINNATAGAGHGAGHGAADGKTDNKTDDKSAAGALQTMSIGYTALLGAVALVAMF